MVVGSPTDAATQAGYARAVPLPYKYLPNPESTFPWLARDLTHIPTAMYSVYSKSVELPDMAYSACCFTICLPNSLEVCINGHNEEATSAGYANAVPLPISRSNIYVDDLNMLDTDYAASLVDFPRFG